MVQGQTRLLYPGLAGFYGNMLPIALTFLRIVVGIMFLVHVSAKFRLGAGPVAANIFAKNGVEPALIWAYIVMFLESVGGACLIIGLFTRFPIPIPDDFLPGMLARYQDGRKQGTSDVFAEVKKQEPGRSPSLGDLEAVAWTPPCE